MILAPIRDENMIHGKLKMPLERRNTSKPQIKLQRSRRQGKKKESRA